MSTESERFEKLKEVCNEYLDFVKSDEYMEDNLSDYEHNIFELATEYILGDGIFDKINKIIDNHEEGV